MQLGLCEWLVLIGMIFTFGFVVGRQTKKLDRSTRIYQDHESRADWWKNGGKPPEYGE